MAGEEFGMLVEFVVRLTEQLLGRGDDGLFH
jgi:hypothetical protein